LLSRSVSASLAQRWMAAVLVSCIAIGGARGDEAGDVVRQHFQAGTSAFDLGLYDKAISQFTAAYEVKRDPVLLYNIAQAYRLAGHPREASRFYRVYLERTPDAPNRAEVEGKLAELHEAIERLEATQTRLPPDQTQPSQQPPAATNLLVQSTAPERAPRPLSQRWWLWTTVGGVVVAGVAVGLGVGLSSGQAAQVPLTTGGTFRPLGH
jgi:tetratricopeptide (TPR) repeat protein